MEKLEGKTAFVTGGANGIGFALVQAFLSERTRPDELMPEDDTAESAARAHSEVMQLAMNTGIQASEVAQLVVDGIKQNRLYLFPHPELEGSAEIRVQAILDAFGEADPERVRAQEAFMSSLLKQ